MKIYLGRVLVCAVMVAVAACSGLPDTSQREKTFTQKDTAQTRLGAVSKRQIGGHPGQSGVYALGNGADAKGARFALADMAERTLDLQYYIWRSDDSGLQLVAALMRAADRGVRIRLLLDDLGTMASDEGLLFLDGHPNIEVRLFNPVTMRGARILGALLDFKRANRRMHNKAFIADSQAAIIGGRNIGDEYFNVHADINFADLDVITVGPVVGEVCQQFDDYWNSPSSIEIRALNTKRESAEKRAAFMATLQEKYASAQKASSLKTTQSNAVTTGLKKGDLRFIPSRAWAVYDAPSKVTSKPHDRTDHLAPQLLSIVDQTQKILLIVSPYFVPEKRGVKLLTDLRKRGVRVIVLTNSLAATDVAAVHSGYARYRKPLLEGGVELYELKAADSSTQEGERGSSFFKGSSRASLHAKTFAFDDRTVFVGSMNLDPRSIRLNTEIGVLIESRELTSALMQKAVKDLGPHAYQVQLEKGKLVWLTEEDGKKIRLTQEPDTTRGQRFKVKLIGLLPIEGQL